MNNTANSTCKQDQLHESVSQVSFLVQNWERGDQCFLSLKEIELLLKFTRTTNKLLLAAELGLKPDRLNKLAQYIILKLQFNHSQFKLLITGGISYIVPYPPFGIYCVFLSASLKRHRLSARLHNMLIAMGCKTISDVLNYSTDDLMYLHGIGSQSIEEFKRLLSKHDCSHLLKN